MGGDYSISHAACLAAQLPPDSRTLVAVDPLCAYASPTNRLLALIEFHAHTAWWQRTDDARREKNAPRLLFARASEGTQGKANAMEIDEIAELLARPRKEVQQHGES